MWKALMVFFLSSVNQASSKGICYGTGDPHFKTFDGKSFDFMAGNKHGKECKFLFFGRCKAINDLPYFRVLIINSHWGNPRVSWVDAVELHLDGHVIRMDYQLQNSGEIMIDDRKVKANNYRGIRGLVITTKPPRETRLTFARKKVTITYRPWNIHAEADSSLRGKGLCGLCGNYDGNKLNDQRQRNGRNGNWDQIGWSYQAPDLYGKYCTKESTRPCKRTKCQEASQCDMLRDEKVFGECVRHLKFWKGCAEDACCAFKNFDRCETFRTFVRDCAMIHAPVPDTWKRKSGCGDPSCPAYSSYDQNASPCQPTCDGMNRDCNKEKTKGACVCHHGYVWSGNKCVREERCLRLREPSDEILLN